MGAKVAGDLLRVRLLSLLSLDTIGGQIVRAVCSYCSYRYLHRLRIVGVYFVVLLFLVVVSTLLAVLQTVVIPYCMMQDLIRLQLVVAMLTAFTSISRLSSVSPAL